MTWVVWILLRFCFFRNKTVRMTVQPTSKMSFKGDWGCSHNKHICEECPKGQFEKMSKPVQVYTACQFVNPAHPSETFMFGEILT